MIDKIHLAKLIDYALQPQKRKGKEKTEVLDKGEAKVSLSSLVKALENLEVEEDLKKKVEELKKALEENRYEVNDEKIKKALERFFL